MPTDMVKLNKIQDDMKKLASLMNEINSQSMLTKNFHDRYCEGTISRFYMPCNCWQRKYKQVKYA